MTDESIIAHTVEIVAAHVSNNAVPADTLPALIKSVHDALSRAGEAVAPLVEKREPAVSIRSSVKPDAITCLECGARFKMLKRHLSTDHGLTPEEYKAHWALNADYPLVAPDYAAVRKGLALKIGLGRKPGTVVKKPAAKAQKKKTSTPESGALPA